MDRRTFIGSAYSLYYFGGQLEAAPQQRDFKVLAPDNAPHSVAAEPNMAVVDLETDLLVCGGGLSGVCAALAAARRGTKVVLVQDRSRLGGNSSSEVKMHVVGANSHKGRSGWRESGLIEEIRLDDAAANPHRRFELWDLLLYDKVISEPNITLLLESAVYRAEKNGDKIERAWVRCDKAETLYRIKAKMYMDATGDSRLGLEAGAEMRTGRELKTEFGESLAAEKPDKTTLGSSILFTARDFGVPTPFTPPSWARKISAEQLKMRKITSWEYGYWWIEWGGEHDLIRDNERIRFELMSITLGIWDYIKNSGNHPTSKNWGLEWVGTMPGKRGSRRMVGDVIVTQHDLMKGDAFEDAVAIGGWPMDDHPPGGFDSVELSPAVQIRTPEVFNLPLRALYSKNVSNLMMAGRNISCSHVAFTSTRVMATCATVGQAAGTAAAMCCESGLTPRQLYERKTKLKQLQQALLRDDQTIRNVRNEDPTDLARKAKVTASGEMDDAPPSNVLNGWTRNIPGKQTHYWQARMADDGAWLALEWDAAQKIGEVQLTFDTGFQRELTLSAQDGINNGIIRAPQPETVRDYEVQVRKAGASEWMTVATVAGNHQRMRRHKFDAVSATAVRVRVKATNGIQFARLFEVRCYS